MCKKQIIDKNGLLDKLKIEYNHNKEEMMKCEANGDIVNMMYYRKLMYDAYDRGMFVSINCPDILIAKSLIHNKS